MRTLSAVARSDGERVSKATGASLRTKLRTAHARRSMQSADVRGRVVDVVVVVQ